TFCPTSYLSIQFFFANLSLCFASDPARLKPYSPVSTPPNRNAPPPAPDSRRRMSALSLPKGSSLTPTLSFLPANETPSRPSANFQLPTVNWKLSALSCRPSSASSLLPCFARHSPLATSPHPPQFQHLRAPLLTPALSISCKKTGGGGFGPTNPAAATQRTLPSARPQTINF